MAASTKTQRNLPFSHELAGSVSSNRSERGREGGRESTEQDANRPNRADLIENQRAWSLCQGGQAGASEEEGAPAKISPRTGRVLSWFHGQQIAANVSDLPAIQAPDLFKP